MLQGHGIYVAGVAASNIKKIEIKHIPYYTIS